MIRDDFGQGAIEYLIIIGGAILVAAIVLSILISTASKGQNKVDQTFDDFNQVSRSVLDEVDIVATN